MAPTPATSRRASSLAALSVFSFFLFWLCLFVGAGEL